MTENSPTPKEYVKKESTIPALQWDGSLDQVTSVTQWVLQYDPNAQISATFSSEGMYLRILTNGIVLGVGSGDFIVVVEGKITSFSEESFLENYQEADVSAYSPGNALARLSEDK